MPPPPRAARHTAPVFRKSLDSILPPAPTPRCPRCGFELVGLAARGTCPECGGTFDPDSARRVRPLPPLSRALLWIAAPAAAVALVALATVILIALARRALDDLAPRFMSAAAVPFALIATMLGFGLALAGSGRRALALANAVLDAQPTRREESPALRGAGCLANGIAGTATLVGFVLIAFAALALAAVGVLVIVNVASAPGA